MENFSSPFLTTNTNPSTITTSTTSSSSNISLAQQNMYMSHLQNVNFVDKSGQLGFVEPCFVPYNQNLQFQYVNSFPQVMNQPPLYSFPTGQSNASFRMLNSELQGWSQPGEEYRKKMEPWMSKVARERRKQARQNKSRSFAPATPLVPERTIREQAVTSGGSNVMVTDKQNRNTNVFYTPDGKRLEEILTKELKNSDVNILGRIVLPKKEAEMNLPTLQDKEGIDVVLKDVYSELQWSMKYKYWSNNKSRMYILENIGDFVNHYELQMGHSITLYEDEFKNLYVLIKKEQNQEVSETLSSMESVHTKDTYNYSHMQTPYTHQAKDNEEEAYMALLRKELNHKKEAKAANSLLTQRNGGSSSSGTKYDNTVQHQLPNDATKRASNQGTEEAAPNINDDQQNNFDDVYRNLDNIFEIGHNDYKMW